MSLASLQLSSIQFPILAGMSSLLQKHETALGSQALSLMAGRRQRVAQAAIDNRVPNAPGIKIADATNLIGKKTEPSVSDLTQTQPQPEPKLQPLPEIKLQPKLPEKGYFRK